MSLIRFTRVLFRYGDGGTIEAVAEPRAIGPGNRAQLHIVRAFGASQDGVVRRAQLLERGVSRSAIARALRSGTLHRLHRGVYSVVPPELLSEDALLLSALFAAGPRRS